MVVEEHACCGQQRALGGAAWRVLALNQHCVMWVLRMMSATALHLVLGDTATKCLNGTLCRRTGGTEHAPPDWPACCFEGHAFKPNGLEQTPLRGWRSWQAFADDIDQQVMEDIMRGVAKRRPLGPGGAMVSLADMGYRDVGLDAGYEMIGHGYMGSCHTESGHMLINTTRFPSFEQMTGTAHALNLTASWYLNNDPCKGLNETAVGHTYRTDSEDAVRYGFDGVKFDSQALGPNDNITEWAIALNATGKPMLIENCEDKNPLYLLTDPTDCPFNHYRTGPDNSPSFFGGLNHIFTWTVPYLRVTQPVPASRPGCFAYPDLLGIGAPVSGTAAFEKARQMAGCTGMTLDEERTLFANWAIISSPLVLGLDTRDDAVVEKYWSIIANENALSINSDWAGSAGLLFKQSDQTRSSVPTPIGATCPYAHNATFPQWLLYVKRLSRGAVAALVINTMDEPLPQFEVLTFEELRGIATEPTDPGSINAIERYNPVDVWTGAALSAVTSANPWVEKGLAPHNSTFVMFMPETVH